MPACTRRDQTPAHGGRQDHRRLWLPEVPSRLRARCCPSDRADLPALPAPPVLLALLRRNRLLARHRILMMWPSPWRRQPGQLQSVTSFPMLTSSIVPAQRFLDDVVVKPPCASGPLTSAAASVSEPRIDGELRRHTLALVGLESTIASVVSALGVVAILGGAWEPRGTRPSYERRADDTMKFLAGGWVDAVPGARIVDDLVGLPGPERSAVLVNFVDDDASDETDAYEVMAYFALLAGEAIPVSPSQSLPTLLDAGCLSTALRSSMPLVVARRRPELLWDPQASQLAAHRTAISGGIVRDIPPSTCAELSRQKAAAANVKYAGSDGTHHATAEEVGRWFVGRLRDRGDAAAPPSLERAVGKVRAEEIADIANERSEEIFFRALRNFVRRSFDL